MASIHKQTEIECIRQKLARQIRKQESGMPLPSSDRFNLESLFSAEHVSGAVVELVSAGSGAGALSLACWIGGRLQKHQRGSLVIVDAQHEFYPPGAVALGVQLEQTIIVRARTQREVLWSVEQSLRCPGVAAVVCRLQHTDERVGRRLMLAAEVGKSVGVFLQPQTAQPVSFASMRFHVEAVPTQEKTTSMARKLAVKTLYLRGQGFQENLMYVDVGQQCEAA